MAKLKNSIFLLEQENALHVYQAQELYDKHIYEPSEKTNI